MQHLRSSSIEKELKTSKAANTTLYTKKYKYAKICSHYTSKGTMLLFNFPQMLFVACGILPQFLRVWTLVHTLTTQAKQLISYISGYQSPLKVSKKQDYSIFLSTFAERKKN